MSRPARALARLGRAGRSRLAGHWRPATLVAFGGSVGATLRHVVGAAAGGALPTTLAVNAVGSFGLGLVLFDARAGAVLPGRLRFLLGAGFLASFTTYSTLVADAALTAPAVAALYVAASYAAGFGGVVASRAVVAGLSSREIASLDAGGD